MPTPRTATAPSWDADEATPVASPTASAAVSRTPTLVDLVAYAQEQHDKDVEAGNAKALEAGEVDEQDRHKAHHDGLLHLPSHPHQHLEQYLPPDHYPTTAEVSADKEVAGAEQDAEKAQAATFDDYPDGGLKAWLVVAGAWAISFTAWGYANAYGVLLSYYSTHSLASYPESSLAWIGAFQIAANLFCAVFAGKLFDAGYVKHLLCAGLLVYTAGLFGLSYADQYWQVFLAQGLACGLASGLTFLPACSAVSHYFKKRRMLALGVLATGSSMGGVLYPSLLNKLIYTVGYGWAIRTVGFINVALLAFACLVIDTRLPPRPLGKLSSWLDFTVFVGKENRGYTLYVCGAAIVWLGLYTPIFYSEQYALFHNVSHNIAFYSLAMLNAASVIGRTIPNYFADSYGPLNLLIPATFVSGLMIFFWIPAMMNSAGVVVWSTLFGAFQGAFVSMLPAAVASLTDDMRTIGIRMAMAFLLQSTTALVGTPIAGYIISSRGGQAGYVGAGVYSGVVVLVGVALITWARFETAEKRGTPFV
ncbi:hypothetical protein BMF94_0396 [Rhodotorula taiwanensis]|uniref:Major facilitator superfamily (MFS) profile domain-containing protein n=1 Tax=Rhodotorula taiwanensis TaxID=741276 RepID=A0A2S5BIG9_9BASI|nr:hypothetical protein BMF94_0396 [Rhodotorula taiwanensis]